MEGHGMIIKDNRGGAEIGIPRKITFEAVPVVRQV